MFDFVFCSATGHYMFQLWNVHFLDYSIDEMGSMKFYLNFFSFIVSEGLMIFVIDLMGVEATVQTIRANMDRKIKVINFSKPFALWGVVSCTFSMILFVFFGLYPMMDGYYYQFYDSSFPFTFLFINMIVVIAIYVGGGVADIKLHISGYDEDVSTGSRHGTGRNDHVIDSDEIKIVASPEGARLYDLLMGNPHEESNDDDDNKEDEDESNIKYCTVCGEKLDENAIVCPKCGNILE